MTKLKLPKIFVAGLKQFGVGTLYVLFGVFIHHFFTKNNIVGVIWPGTGLALAAVLLGGRSYLLGIFLGSLTLNVLSNQSLWAVFGITLANVLEAFIGGWLITRNYRSPFFLRTLSDYLRLISLGGGVACVLGAVIGALALLQAGIITPADYTNNVLIWWIGDTLGAMLITPLILAWWQTRIIQLTGQQWLEIILLMGFTIILGQIVFLDWFDGRLLFKPKAFIFFFFITWIAIRLGVRATIITVNLIAIQALSGAFLKIGYFANEIHIGNFQNYWIYILTLSMVGMAQSTYVNDIRQKELSLRESEQHFRTLANSGTALIWTSGVDKLCDYFNEPWLRFTNQTLEQELGHGWTEGVHPEDLDRCLQTYTSAFDQREPFSMEYRMRHADGSYHWLQDNGNPRYDIKGNFIGYIGFCYDITERKHDEERLRQSEEKLRTYFDNISDTLWLIDSNLYIVYVSPNVFRLLNYLPEELIGLFSACIIHPDDMVIVSNAQRYVMEHKGEPHTIQYRVSHKNGRWVEVESTGVNLLSNSDIKGVLVSMRDITERKQVETDLRIAATVFEAQEGMFVTNAQSEILRVNRAFTSITGYSLEEVIGKNPRILQSGHQPTEFYTLMWDCINRTGFWEGEVWNRRKNGEVYPEHLTITAVKGSDGIVVNYVATLTDITLSKAAAVEIERLAFYDPLTGLPNRQLLRDRLIPALASSHRTGQKGALLFIDMDNFKTLNDTLGHDMGDILLQKVAQRLESCVRERDTVARLGGDEFVVILEDLSEQALEAAAQTEAIGNKILTTLNQPYWLETHSYDSTCSIGATLFHNHEQSIDELLKQADIAMYQAKSSGRNALSFFDPKMQASINARVALEADLRQALKENQFRLFYQPQVYQNHLILGAEVLIRWQHPVKGIVPPSDFIPLAEETGLMMLIGRWVMEAACAQIKNWASRTETQDLQLAVNVSSRQFRQLDFVEQVCEILLRNEIDPGKLKMELTESLILDDIDDAINKMNALREIGVRFSIDDFGTGYSSLAYLTKLPLDQLKIDQSFVRNIGVKNTDAVIVQTIIGMAKNLGMEVIAEGVETEEQRLFLELHGCQVCQGYLFSQPLAIEQFESLLKHD